MACSYGSEPKRGVTAPVEVRFRDIVDLGKVEREDLSYAGGGLIMAWDILTFCNVPSNAHHQPVRGAYDSLTRAFNAIVDEKWNENCKCKPAPELFPTPGGQCPVVYRVRGTESGLDYRPPFEPINRVAYDIRMRGPITTSYTRVGNGTNIANIAVNHRPPVPGDVYGTVTSPMKPGTEKLEVRFDRIDGGGDDCGSQSDRAPYEPNIPGGLVFAPLDPASICPTCDSPAPGILFIPAPVPVPIPPVIIPIPVPVPIPLPPLPCPPCNCPSPLPDPIPPRLPPAPEPPPPPKPMDCCPELISRLVRLQSDVSGIRDDDIPKLKEDVYDKLDGLEECLDFARNRLGQESSVGSGVTGTSVLPTRAIALRVTAITPAPANKSYRQSGGDTPDVIQGGWCWLGKGGDVSLRIPLDAEEKLIVVPSELRPMEPLTFTWRGVHGISYNVVAIRSQERTSPPYEVRSCQE